MHWFRRATAVTLALALPAIAVALSFTTPADASMAYESPYTFEQTFGTALRLIRVDMGYKLKEKDGENGFLLFDYTSPESGKRVTQGSIECVRTANGVHVVVQLAAMPRYHEQVILDHLMSKLVSEHGDPPKVKPAPAPVPPPQPAPPDDGGADAGDGGAPT